MLLINIKDLWRKSKRITREERSVSLFWRKLMTDTELTQSKFPSVISKSFWEKKIYILFCKSMIEQRQINLKWPCGFTWLEISQYKEDSKLLQFICTITFSTVISECLCWSGSVCLIYSHVKKKSVTRAWQMIMCSCRVIMLTMYLVDHFFGV